MSEGKRYWGAPHQGSNYVTCREIGDIPGCVPAVDVFVERGVSQVQYFNDQQIPVYARAIRKEGPWPQTLLPISNPAPKSKGSYYSS